MFDYDFSWFMFGSDFNCQQKILRNYFTAPAKRNSRHPYLLENLINSQKTEFNKELFNNYCITGDELDAQNRKDILRNMSQRSISPRKLDYDIAGAVRSHFLVQYTSRILINNNCLTGTVNLIKDCLAG